jgi:hypothetical protein
MASALVFVLTPEERLPPEGACWSDLLQAQAHGLRSAITLRIFAAPTGEPDALDALINAGSADIRGANPYGSSQGRTLCNALVPHIEPRSLGIGVYELNGIANASAATAIGTATEQLHGPTGLAIESIRCLDRFALRQAENETCWFYPTDAGHYLSWENRSRLRTEPGFLPEIPPQDIPSAYRREDIHVLWSLMADDLALTCVGLTYAKRRIEWPLLRSEPEECATWTSFRIDPMAEESYEELSSISVFGVDPAD